MEPSGYGHFRQCAEEIIKDETSYRDLKYPDFAKSRPPFGYFAAPSSVEHHTRRRRQLAELQRLKDQCDQTADGFRLRISFSKILQELNAIVESVRLLQRWDEGEDLFRKLRDGYYSLTREELKQFDERVAAIRSAMTSDTLNEFGYLCRHPEKAAVGTTNKEGTNTPQSQALLVDPRAIALEVMN